VTVVSADVVDLPVDLGVLPACHVSARLGQLRLGMDAAGCDALLVTSLTNIRYLTGFTGSAALLWVDVDGALFVTDGRYAQQSYEQLSTAEVVADIEVPATGAGQRAAMAARATQHGAHRIGLEAEHVTWAAHQRYTDEWFCGVELVPTVALVEGLRVVKDVGEVARIAAACAIADTALANVRSRLHDGPTERDFAGELDGEMRRLGADDVSFETIVASGPNGARPHARPGNRRIDDGDLVVVDFGALLDGYHSDMTRTFQVGEPTDVQRRMWDVVRDAQQAGLEAVRPGVPAADVDRACRSVIEEAGWGDAFLHSTGHGVGLDIHEAPRVGATDDATIAAGHVVTVEPGVYLPEHGGVRIEDTVVVTEGGCRLLTATAKIATP